MILYQLQIDNGMYFLHEHPYSAKSWDLPEVKSISQQPGVEIIRGDMCCFGMYQDTPGGPMLVKKPTGFMTNAAGISAELGVKCEGGTNTFNYLMGEPAEQKFILMNYVGRF